MEEEIPELNVEEYDHVKKIIYLAKELLLTQDKLNIVSGTDSCLVASIAAQSLVFFGYVKYENIQTLTEVRNDKRNIKLIISLKKKKNFQQVYDKSEEDKKKKIHKKE